LWIVWELVTAVWCYRLVDSLGTDNLVWLLQVGLVCCYMLVDCLGTDNSGAVLQVGGLSGNR